MNDKISALMDGELDEKSAAELIDWLGRDGEALHAWRAYHLISDAMRDSCMLSDGFAARVAAVSLVGWLAFAPQRDAGPLQAQVAQVPAALAPALRPDAGKKPPAMVPLPSGANDYLLAHQGFSPRASLQGMAPYVRTVSDSAQESTK